MIKSILGGVCISLGAFASCGIDKPWNGLVFSVGLLLIILLQFSLFTGNVLKARDGITKELLIEDWLKVILGNLIGCVLFASLIQSSGYDLTVITEIAQKKAELSPMQAFIRGIPCNMLVCIAVYLSQLIKENNITRILCIMIPVALFVISGYEHSVANMFYYAVGNTSFNNLIPVILGNIIGGLLIIKCTNKII